MSLEGAPIYSRFMRLTNEQWRRSVQDILGLAAAPAAAQGFERPVAGTTDFANNEHVLGGHQRAVGVVSARIRASSAARHELESER